MQFTTIVNEGCAGGYMLPTLEYAFTYEVFDEESYPYVGYDQ